MASTNFKQWNPPANNMESDTNYNADTLRANGIPSGVGGSGVLAPSITHNKLFYQVTTFVTALANFLVGLGLSPNDGSASPSTALANLTAIFQSAFAQPTNTSTYKYSATGGSTSTTGAILYTFNIPTSILKVGSVVHFVCSVGAVSASAEFYLGGTIIDGVSGLGASSFYAFDLVLSNISGSTYTFFYVSRAGTSSNSINLLAQSPGNTSKSGTSSGGNLVLTVSQFSSGSLTGLFAYATVNS